MQISTYFIDVCMRQVTFIRMVHITTLPFYLKGHIGSDKRQMKLAKIIVLQF